MGRLTRRRAEWNPATGADGEPPVRRRPRRLRRWVVRPLVWGLTALAILLFLGQRVLDSAPVRDRIRREIEQRVGERLGQPVTIGDVSVAVLTGTVTLRQVRVGGDGEMPPLVEIPLAMVDADATALSRRKVRLHHVRLDRPEIHLAFFESGDDNLVRWNRRATAGRLEVFLDRFEVIEGQILVDHHRARVSFVADDVEAQLDGRGEMRLAGRAEARNVAVELPGARRREGLSAAATVVFQRGRLGVEDARLDGSGLALRVQGECRWGGDQRCQLQVRGHTEGRVLAELGYFDDVDGRFETEGTLDWRPGSLGWRSRISASTLSLWGRTMTGLDGVLAADRQGVQLGVERLAYAGGAVTGTVSMDLRNERDPIEVDLALSGLGLDALLADQQVPLSGFDTVIDGRVRYRCARRAGRQGDGSAEIALLPGGEGLGIELLGSFPLRIVRGVVQIDGATTRAREQTVLTGGNYDLRTRSGQFDYEIVSRDVGALAAVVPVRAEAPPPWLPSGGEGTIRGTLHVVPRGASSEVEVQLDRVRAPVLESPHPVRGSFRVDPDGVRDLRLEIGDADTALAVRGSYDFVTGEGEAGPVDPPVLPRSDITIDAVAWPIDEVRRWVPYDLPVDGPVSGRLVLHTAEGRRDGSLVATASPARLAGRAGLSDITLDALSTKLSWDAEVMRVEELIARSAAGEVRGHGEVDWRDRRVQMALSCPGLRLDRAPLAAYRPRPDLSGRVAVAIDIGGTLDRPVVDLDASFLELVAGGHAFPGPSRVQGRWDGRRLQLDGRLLGALEVRGDGSLTPAHADLELAVSSEDLSSLAIVFGDGFRTSPLAGNLAGTVHLEGDLAEGAPALTAELGRLRLDRGGRVLENRGPVRFAVTSTAIEIDALELAEQGTDSFVRLAGTVPFDAAGELALSVTGEVSSDWPSLGGFDGLSDGVLAFDGTVAGSRRGAWLEGAGSLRGGALRLPASMPHELRDLDGVVRFDREGVVIEGLRGRFAGGTVEADGRIEISSFGAAATRPAFRIQLVGRDLSLLIPEGWTLDGDADLVVSSRGGAEAETVIRGQASVARAVYGEDLAIGFGQVVRRVFERHRLEVDAADPLLSQVRLDVAVGIPGGLRIRNNLAELTGRAELILRGTAARPVLYGAVDLDAGGTMVYQGTEYRLERGRLVFAHPTKIDPEVDLVATTRVREFDVRLSLNGTLERLDAGFSSEPPLPDLEVFRLLATGEVAEGVTSSVVQDLTQRDDGGSTSAASFLYGQAASVVGERVGALFGLDTFRIDPLTGSGDALSRARITVGKRLSKDLFVRYSADPASTEDQRLQVEWQVARNVVLVLTQNGDETYAADVRWEQTLW